MTKLLAVALAAFAITVSAATNPPNVIFILADDLGWSDTTFNHTTNAFYETPHIERLARRGLRFTQAYAANPLCSPTRASILTGLYPARIGITAPNYHLPDVVFEKSLNKKAAPTQKVLVANSVTRFHTNYFTLAEVFKDAGYATGHFGKWHLGAQPFSPLQHGFDVDLPHTPGPSPAGSYIAPWKFPPALKFAGQPGEHIEDRMTQEAIQFIKSNRDKPFFVNYWAFSVHAPYDAKKELIEKYRAKAAKLPPGSPQRNAVYGAMVQSLDENVGRLLDTLDELKLSDNTIIVFSSDNGGVHWSAGKGDAAKVESTDIPITSNAPYPFQHGWSFGTAWADAGVICPWAIWQAYGDTRIIERCWPDMVEFMNWRKSTSKEFLGINHGNDWGDWLSFGTKTPLDYVDTVYFAYSTKLMADMAATIGKQSEAAEYRELLGNIKTAFNAKYVKPDGSLAVDTQTAYALAIYMDLLPADVRAKSGKILANKLRSGETADNSGMTTGFIGTRPLLPVLSSVGEHDLAVKHFQSHKFPSWGYEVNQGATTIWERWNSYTKDKGFGGEQNASMNSFSHYAFGAVCEWMFFELAGIDSDGPGYRKVIIRPSPPTPGSNPERAPIDWVKAHYDSIHGRIVSNWRLKEGRFELETTIPANTTATVYLPTIESDKITESGKLLAKAKGVKLLRVENNRTVLAVESGTYRFDCAEFKGATSGTMAAAK